MKQQKQDFLEQLLIRTSLMLESIGVHPQKMRLELVDGSVACVLDLDKDLSPEQINCIVQALSQRLAIHKLLIKKRQRFSIARFLNR
jgi:hypothetical protein